MSSDKIQSIKSFLNEGIWQVNTEELPRMKRIGYNTLKITLLTIRQFGNDHILDRAASITYTTLFSIIPILALLFAIAKGFGFGNILQEQMRENSFIINHQYDMIFSLIDSYLTHAKSGIFIGAGIIMLFVSVYFLTNAIEQNINAIWQAQKPRNILRMITDYFSMLLVTPILMVATSGITIFMTTYVKEIEGFMILGPLMQFVINLIPFIITCSIFIAIYIFVPNTHVKFNHIIIPGILAGTAFQGFQYFYINSQIWVSNYNAIYGSFAAIPLFLLWANISWVICLVGVEIAYLSQNLDSFNYDLGTKKISRLNHDFIATIIMSLLCKRLDKGGNTYTPEELSKEIRLPIRLTKKILLELVSCRLVYRTTDFKDNGNATRYIPAVDISKASVESLLNTLDTHGENSYLPDTKKYGREWQHIQRVRKEFLSKNTQTLLKDL